MNRARRAKAKRIDYAKEQEFSDADIFEDSEPEEPEQPKRRGRPRKSSGPKHDIPRRTTVGEVPLGDGDIYEVEKPIYTERGYDPTLPSIRERFPFLPEYEEDGSPKIDLIVGRRPVDEKEDAPDESDEESLVEDDDDESVGRTTRKRSSIKKSKKAKEETESSGQVDYEYLVKYKGRSYLHLNWKTGGDLESMNKSAKGIYRRYVKKVTSPNADEELESPEFDPSYAIPEKIVQEAEQEITEELTDAELIRWEKKREKERAEEEDNEDDDESNDKEQNDAAEKETTTKIDEAPKERLELKDDGWGDEELDFSKLTLEKLRTLVDTEGPYYPKVEGSDNPYRDGYVTEPPKKPRASYLFFQCTMRSYFAKKNPKALQSELMTMLGDKWRTMSDGEKEPFLQLAREEAAQYDKERILMEKAQKPSEVWQPIRRCRMVLDRLVKDSYSEVFLEPVDLDDFPEYEETIDQPMDLGTVRTKLETRKYQAPEQFARDVRRVWNNCKIFNLHGSAIWHVADYMSKQFERLYHAWVLEFRERYLRWANPKARPWETTCRITDGCCNTPDDQMVLCDHCDAMYSYKCLGMKKVPSKAWHCPDCKPKLKSAKGVRMLSAIAENAARKRADLGDIPKKTIKRTMYLVKWAGLGYEHCTWETKEDISDSKALIEKFHRLNKTFPDEPDMPCEVIDKFLGNVKHLRMDNAGGVACIPLLRSQLYAQSRAYQFLKFAMDLPKRLGPECGPKSGASLLCSRSNDDVDIKPTTSTSSALIKPEPNDGDDSADPDKSDSDDPMDNPATTTSSTLVKSQDSHHYPREVFDCVADMVFRVARKEQTKTTRGNTFLHPPLAGEYDAVVPITSKGLMMNVGEIHGSVAFLGYRSFPDGSKGPAQLKNLIRNVGDKIIAVDGNSTIGKSFKEVIGMLRESGKNKFAYMRFLENKYSVCDSELASVGLKGKYAFEELRKKFTVDRQRMVVERKQKGIEDEQEEAPDEEEENDPTLDIDSDESSDGSEGSEGEFEPDSDVEELNDTRKAVEASPASDAADKQQVGSPNQSQEKASSNQMTNGDIISKEEKKELESAVVSDSNDKEETVAPGFLQRCETTRSLAYRLLNVDVGYSSDEGGDEDCAYYLDGVDNTFTAADDLSGVESSKTKKDKKNEAGSDTIPAKQNEFSAKGDRGKLASAVVLAPHPPSLDDFDNFPFESTKAIDAAKKLKEKAEEESQALLNGVASPAKKAKRSTVKIEQVSVATGEVLHVWANVEAAAATLQLKLPELKRLLVGEYDVELGDEVGGYKWRYALAGAKVTAGTGSNSRGGAGKKAKEAWLEFRDKLYDPNEPHTYKGGNRLRDYQVDGVNWLASTWYKRHGCILADEMGLGKTVQIVAYIEHLHRVEKVKRPYLVVVPLSTVEHWRREFEGWTDMVCCVYHDRQRVWRDVMREYEWYFEDRPHTPEFLKFDVLVTTYDTLIGDFDIISQIPFRVSVVDEAHRLRNQKGKLLECMKEISAKGTMQYGFQSRILMSGTPLQNDLTELWTLLSFIEPFKFPDLEDFQRRYGNMDNKEQVESLQRMISPFMLRRVKEDVAKDIPAKEETLIDVELTSIQKQYYRAIFEHNHAFLNMGSTRQTAPKLMNIQMELRKVCNHPFLLDGVEHRETDRQYKEFTVNGEFEGKTHEEQQFMLNQHGYIMTSGKMVLLDKLLPKLRREGHKILIFSQMVKMLDLISEYCEFRDFPYERLDGRVRGTERQKAIDRFEREKNSFLFLLSTRAGGVGINLTAADICIIFDSDWNPQNDVQAQARCHRIGQTKDVRIYRLITSRSFEQEMFERASKKLGLEQAVLGTFDQSADDEKPSQKEMERLLKKGAYALLEDENDEITKEFCSDDIESILQKRTRTRVVEGAKTSSWLNKAGVAVTKSKFSAEAGGASLDMDDPMFWQKVMPDFVTPAIMLQKLNDLQDEIEGTTKKGPGRGRGRWKKQTTEDGEKDKVAKADSDDVEKVETKEEEAEGVIGVDDKVKATEEGTGEGADEGKTEDGNVEATEEGAGEGADEGKTEDDNVEATEEGMGEAADEGKAEDDSDGDEKKTKKFQLSRTSIRKVHKFISDLKSMMDGVFDSVEDETLSQEEKDACEKLLLTISVKDRMFNEEQQHLAKKFLKRLEGDRRRRCRTSDQPRFNPGATEEDQTNANLNSIPDELRIVARKKKKRQKRSGKKNSENGNITPGEDGYLHHSDSEDDWSEVADDIYDGGKKRERISRKEARRRRQWAAGDDPREAAGRPWPSFPRHVVVKVLASILDDVVKDDEEKGGVFSMPVSREDYPEYYDQIKKPMDYQTMRTKLENGEYRSAQSMQKDFILILQNCRQFNAPTSEIVKEAREQHLRRPSVLKSAAAKHDLFICEDGTVLEIFDEKKEKKQSQKRKRETGEGNEQKREKRKKTGKNDDEDEDILEDHAVPRKRKGKKKKKPADGDEDEKSGEEEPRKKKKNRIRIKVKGGKEQEGSGDEKEPAKGKKGKKKTVKRKRAPAAEGDGSDTDDEATETPKRKRKKSEVQSSKKKKRKKDVSKQVKSAEDGANEGRYAEPVDAKVDKGNESENGKAPPSVFLDLSFWKNEREELDSSFEAGRRHLVTKGAWELPEGVSDEKFSVVAKITLEKMDKHDRYDVFSQAVTDDEAPGYSDIVKKPMDFGTMWSKVEKGEYGTGNEAIRAFYEDFLLTFDNCRLYNAEGGEVIDEASRILALLPEAYVSACVTVSKRSKKG